MSISKFGTTNSLAPTKVIGIENKVSKSGDIMYGDLNLNRHSIKNLANPEEESDSVNKGFLDSKFIRFKDNIQLNAKLAVIGNDRIRSRSLIYVQDRNLIGVSSIRPLSHENYISNNIYIYNTRGFIVFKRCFSPDTLFRWSE